MGAFLHVCLASLGCSNRKQLWLVYVHGRALEEVRSSQVQWEGGRSKPGKSEVGKPGFHTEWPALWSLMGRGHFLRTADQTTYHHSEQFHLCSHIGSMGAPCAVYVYIFICCFICMRCNSHTMN